MIFLSLFLATASLTESCYESIDPNSIGQNLAFWELHKETPNGQKALKQAQKLIGGGAENGFVFPAKIDSIVAALSGSETSPTEEFDQATAEMLEKSLSFLPNRKLKGSSLDDPEKLFKECPESEIDLAHALLLVQYGSKEIKKRKNLEVTLDLLAAQVIARIGQNSLSDEKIEAINKLLFFDLGFRFPPKSVSEKAIEHYTFLPEVLESRRGVCLGTSIIYYALAQRLGLPLDIYTPPGHIFLAHVDRAIETTARGISIPMEDYLTPYMKKITKRSLKEVIGLVFMNEASQLLQKGSWQKAADLYEKACQFMPQDPLIKELLGCCYFLLDRQKEAFSQLQEAEKLPRDWLAQYDLASDILQKRATKECLEAVLIAPDETRKSLLEKEANLKKALDKAPQFQSGYFMLAMTLIELGHKKEATHYLEKLIELNPCHFAAHLVLCQLFHEQFDQKKADFHFQQAKLLSQKSGLCQKPLEKIALELRTPF